MKIALVAPPWFSVPPPAYGGIEWLCAWLADGLVDHGHDVTLIAAGANGTRAKFAVTYEDPPSARLGESIPEVMQAAKAAAILDGLDVDVIHDHCLAGPLMARGHVAPMIVTAHGPTDGEVGEYYRAVMNNIHLVAITDAQRALAPDIAWKGTVHNAVPVSSYRYSDIKEDFVLFLGRMSPEKGAHLAIDAARGVGLPIVVAGKCIEKIERDYFKEFVRPRLGPEVSWIGEAGPVEKKDLLARARCLVFPIQWEEPFGIVMVEALASGTPVVALSRGSVPEIVEHGVSGLVYDDIDDLPAGIDLCTKLESKDCRARAETMFDVPAMVRGYEEIYKSVTR